MSEWICSLMLLAVLGLLLRFIIVDDHDHRAECAAKGGVLVSYDICVDKKALK